MVLNRALYGIIASGLDEALDEQFTADAAQGVAHAGGRGDNFNCMPASVDAPVAVGGEVLKDVQPVLRQILGADQIAVHVNLQA